MMRRAWPNRRCSAVPSHGPPHRLLGAVLPGCLLGCLLVVAACDPIVLTPAPPARCIESGVQCPLPDGPLGVCERSSCEAGEVPPCFRCISQH